jgi:hypothetical protein
MKGTSLRLFIVFFCTAGSLLILQHAFDVSDHTKAARAVQHYRVPQQPLAFGPFLEARAPGGAWDTEITHGCRGVVRVTYAAPLGTYGFDYDVPGRTFHPASPAAQEAMGAFLGAPPPAGAPHP